MTHQKRKEERTPPFEDVVLVVFNHESTKKILVDLLFEVEERPTEVRMELSGGVGRPGVNPAAMKSNLFGSDRLVLLKKVAKEAYWAHNLSMYMESRRIGF